MEQQINHTAEKKRSYKVRIGCNGATVKALRDINVCHSGYEDDGSRYGKFTVYGYSTIQAGTVFRVEHGDSNAGFRGIECYVKHPEAPEYTGSVSTGALELVGR